MPDYLLQYGVSATIGFPLIGSGTANYATTGSGSLIGTNLQVSKDWGAWATSTNTGTAVPGSGWYSVALTTSELQAKEVVVMAAAGSLGTLVERQSIVIHTWGNASAMYPGDWPGSLMANHTVGTITTLIGVASANVVQILGTSALGTSGTFSNIGTVTTPGSANLIQILGTSVVATGGTLTNIGTVTTLINAASANLVQVLGTAITATGGRPEVNISHWLGTAATGTQGFAGVDMLRINGSATAAQRIGNAAGGVGSGTTTGTLSTTGFSSDLFISTADNFYNGAIVVFLAGTLDLQRTDVTGYNGTTKQATVTGLTVAPINGQAFVLV